jgi:hypothetical protein
MDGHGGPWSITSVIVVLQADQKRTRVGREEEEEEEEEEAEANPLKIDQKVDP